MTLLNAADVIHLGTADVSKIYLGPDLVWQPPYDPYSDPYSSAILADSPLAYWPVDERKGAVAKELVNGWDGNYVGGYTLGGMATPDGNSVSTFNGSNGKVTVPNTGNRLQPTLEFTLEMWFKITDYDAYDSPWGYGSNNWDFRMNPDGVGGSSAANNHWYGVSSGWNGGGYALNAPSGHPFTDGEWHHVVITRSSSTGYIDHYYDGVDVGGGAGTAEAPRDQSNISVLNLAASSARYIGGSVCRVAHYDRILTAGEVADHYKRGRITVGADAIFRSDIDSYASLLEFALSNPAPVDARLDSVTIYAGLAGDFRLVIGRYVNATDLYIVAKSEILTSTGAGIQTFPITPITVRAGDYVGSWSVDTPIIRMEFTGGPFYYTGGDPTVGVDQSFSVSGNRTYSISASGVAV